MNIRAIQERDLDKIKEIHEKYYAHEFSLPNFTKHFIHAFAVIDDFGDIITIGGIRPILEVVALTNKDKGVRDRREALNNILIISEHIAKHDDFDELHVFIQDEIWKKQLFKNGFDFTKGTSLVYKIG